MNICIWRTCRPIWRRNGSAAPGFSSGQAMKAMEEIAKKTLPAGMKYEWTDISYQEKLAAYTVVDLRLGYTLKEHKPLKDMKLALEVNNLFGEKYIVAGYYPGVPFSVLGSISFAF